LSSSTVFIPARAASLWNSFLTVFWRASTTLPLQKAW
jgi:hypothetical protein